ncbi:assimilatory sulfite reductase (NADPH) flavoprotein subunit [Vibrio renipiscarius]|uniref:Sulfite reductase [NADPH] flavoprotein alpha-component n=1 Tax=Vibrio renipiscarius TaxID=1461322 RepID=A0A0C2NZE1_9VIBR|nr:assimilatory sulfite reductase (NADPH) flavoprotein subunit [Vibrio renipiscarius]KII79250.1 sulfite reductase subunit alpha [Vibrio renipiscarius]KII81460.1 sulfite reductase subunit alpha [Vibrio renipiscarius]
MSLNKNVSSQGNTSELPSVASPLNDQQLNQLQQTVTDLSSQQLAWVSGYFWGLAQHQQPVAAAAPMNQAAAAVAAKPAGKLAIIYASQTGNAKGVAEVLEQEAKAQGIATQLFDASDYKGKNLAKETHVIIVASTNGEGEAPDNAIELHEFLQSKKAPKLPNLQYGVIGLGDSSYEFFCQTGKDFDQYLAKQGATSFIDRIDCDVDYEAPAGEWRAKALEVVKEALSSGAEAEVVQLPVGQAAGHSQYTKQNPYTATLLTSQKITGRDSGKDVRHIEVDLDGSGITYQPGDALGVWYENSAELANAILAKVGLSGVESIDVDGESLSIHSALVAKYEITTANPQFVTKFADLSASKKLQKLVEDKDKLREYAGNTQIVDVLAEKKTKLTAEQLVGLLRRLTPRLYSIASAQSEVDEEVHLTVGVVEYTRGEETRFGGASSYLSHRLEEGGEVKVFIENNNNFKLPQDDNTPVIMIGPGTGIAPFRSFIQERDNRDAQGKSWLFFGDRTFTQDFLYQVEWQKYLKSGALSQLDVAFSRDQQEKVYVQHRLLENGQQLWQWIEDGAYLYVCGDATRMAKDVHEALIEVAQEHGKLSKEQAEEFITTLRKEKRYQRDVY